MKVIALADQHGLLPEIPECDLLILGGDLAPDLPITPRSGIGYAAGVKAGATRQLDWFKNEFADWLLKIPARYVVAIAGNHDFGLELPHAARELSHLNWIYLRDSEVTIGKGDVGWQGDPLRIYATPWVPALENWAFYASDDALRHRAAAIPEGLDILITHGPPYGFCDTVMRGHVGDVPLAARLRELSAVGMGPEVVVCGHIHEGFGVEYLDDISIVNAAFVNERYEAVNGLTELVEFSHG